MSQSSPDKEKKTVRFADNTILPIDHDGEGNSNTAKYTASHRASAEEQRQAKEDIRKDHEQNPSHTDHDHNLHAMSLRDFGQTESAAVRPAAPLVLNPGDPSSSFAARRAAAKAAKSGVSGLPPQ